MEKLEYVQRRILQIREFLLSSEPVTSISVNGMSATYDRAGALEELRLLEKQERDLLHPGRQYKSIDLSGAF